MPIIKRKSGGSAEACKISRDFIPASGKMACRGRISGLKRRQMGLGWFT
jgi:hypothetical protein